MEKTHNAVSSYTATQRMPPALASSNGTFLGDSTRRLRRWLVNLTLIASDALLALLVWYAALVVQDAWWPGEAQGLSVADALANVGIWLCLRTLLGLYPGYGLDQVEELRRQTYSVAAALAVAFVIAVAFPTGNLVISFLLVIPGYLGLMVAAPLLRYLVKRGIRRAGLWGKPVAVIGAGEAGERLIRTLQREWSLGFWPVAVFDNRQAPIGGTIEGVPYGGTLTDAMALARARQADTAIFVMSGAPGRFVSRFVNRASDNFRNVIVIPDLAGIATSALAARDFSGIMGVEVRHNLLSPWARRSKRALDLLMVVVGGLLISPLLLTIAVAIKLDSPGPVVFSQKRPGLGGNAFGIFKFRTMYADAEGKLEQLLRENPILAWEYKRRGKLKNDPRVTRVGRFLRRTSLDELPQLWNVLKGDMSLVGPRPYLTSQVPQMNGSEATISRVTPGMSGLWQVSGRSELPFEQRLDLDVYYVRNWSVWLDLVILARTVKSVVLNRGAF